MDELILFLEEWWVFLALVGGTILFLVVVSVVVGRIGHRSVMKRRTQPAAQTVAEAGAPDPATEETHQDPERLDAPSADPAAIPLPAASVETPVPPAPAASMPDPTPEPESALTTVPPPDPAAVIAQPSAVERALPETAPAETPAPPPKEPKPVLGPYHVRFRPADGKWYVSREGSDKILRTLETQTDAVNWATIKALTQNVELIVHKKDGTVRKLPPI